MRICRDNLDILLVFPETPRKTGDCASGSGASNEHANLPLGLCPHLLCGAALVGERVVHIRVLIQNMRVWNLLDQSPCHTDMALGTIPRRTRRCADDFSPKRLEHRHLLGAHLLGERDDGPVSLNCTHERKPDTRVAGCWLDECVAGLYATGLFGRFDHAQGDAVLDTTAGIEGFDLCVDGGADTEGLWDFV